MKYLFFLVCFSASLILDAQVVHNMGRLNFTEVEPSDSTIVEHDERFTVNRLEGFDLWRITNDSVFNAIPNGYTGTHIINTDLLIHAPLSESIFELSDHHSYTDFLIDQLDHLNAKQRYANPFYDEFIEYLEKECLSGQMKMISSLPITYDELDYLSKMVEHTDIEAIVYVQEKEVVLNGLSSKNIHFVTKMKLLE